MLKPVQSESVWLNVDVRRAVVRIPGMVERPQLGLVGWNGGEHIGLERLLGQPPDAVQAPHIVVLVVQIAIPALADQRTVAQVPQLQIREDHFQHVVRQVADGDAGRRLAMRVSRVAPHLPDAPLSGWNIYVLRPPPK